MSDLTTLGTWVRLPLALGADDRMRADEPGSATDFAVIGSNATLAARENELRVLWERGPFEVWADCAETDDERTLRWNATEGDGVLAQFCGVHRVRVRDDGQAPTVTFTVRGAPPSGETLGIVILVLPAFAAPDPLAPARGVARRSTASTGRLSATVTLTPDALGTRTVTPVAGYAPAASVDEQGTMTEVAVYVGAWCTSDSSGAKASLGGMTVYLAEP